MPVPKGYTLDTAPSLPKGYTLDAPQDQTQATSTTDFTANPSGEDRLYRMGSYDFSEGNVTKPEIQVPFSRVKDAQAAGYKLHPDEEPRFQKDFTHQGQGPGLLERFKGTWQQGTETIPDVPLTEVDPNHPVASRVSRLGNAVQNVEQMPWNTLVSTERGLVGLTQLPAQAVETVKQIYQGDPQGMESLFQITPYGIGKSLWDSYQSDTKQYGPTAAVSNLTGNLLTLDLAGKIGGKLGEKVKEVTPTSLADVKAKAATLIPGRSAVEHFTGTTSREIPKMAAKAKAENVAAAEKHLTPSAKAAHETQGKEVDYQRQLNEAEKKAQEEHQKKAEETEAANQRIREKAREAHTNATQKIAEKNLRINAKHAEETKRIDEENKALDNMLEKRRAEEAGLKQDTDDYYVKEDLEKAKAKWNENQAWKQWHTDMDDAPVDGGKIETDLKPILDVSPEARRALHQLVPDPSDADDASEYGKERLRVMESSGYPKGTNYFDLPLQKRIDIDKMTASSGYQPEPIDLDPKAGVSIPLKVIQRAQSILGRNINAGRYEGPLLGEMIQVQQVLRKVVTDESAAHGKTAELDAGRTATQEYQAAFGRERNRPKTQDEIRMRDANPEQYREWEDEQRLNAAAKLAPDLPEAYKKVKERREALKKIPTEDQLRKQRQQIPRPPSIGDPRPGYALDQVPSYESPTVGDLRPGHALQAPPEPPEGGFRAHAERTVKQPPRDLGPDRPKDVTISNEDISAEKQGNAKTTAEELRRMGLRRAMYTTLTSVPFALAMAFGRMGAGGVGEALLGGVLGGTAVFAGTNIIADLLERQDVRAWIGKVTEKDAEAWSKLPPDQKALFTGDMQSLIKVADTKKVPVSPYMRAFVASAAGGQIGKQNQQTNPPTLPEVQKKAQELQQSTPPPAPTPPPPPPGAGASIPLDNLKKIIEQARGLRASSGVKLPYTHIFDQKSGSIIEAA